MCQHHTRCKLQIPQPPCVCRECRHCIRLRVPCTRHCRRNRYCRPWTARGQGMLVCVCVCVLVSGRADDRPHITICLHHLYNMIKHQGPTNKRTLSTGIATHYVDIEYTNLSHTQPTHRLNTHLYTQRTLPHPDTCPQHNPRTVQILQPPCIFLHGMQRRLRQAR